jgi:hypothetical protein
MDHPCTPRPPPVESHPGDRGFCTRSRRPPASSAAADIHCERLQGQQVNLFLLLSSPSIYPAVLFRFCWIFQCMFEDLDWFSGLNQ